MDEYIVGSGGGEWKTYNRIVGIVITNEYM